MSLKALLDILDILDSDSDFRQHNPNHIHACARCYKPTPNMSTCARCQKADWPKHKSFCAEAADVGLANICKFMQRFHDKTKLTLGHYQQSAILHKLRSLNLEISRETTFKITFYVGFEPVDIQDLRKIIKSPTFVDSGKRPLGMLQILDLDVSSQPSAVAMSKPDLANAQRTLDSFGLGFSKCPIVLIDMAYLKSDAQGRVQKHFYSTAAPLFFTNTCFADHPYSITIPTISGNIQGVEKPRSLNSCLEYINMSIRNDHQNQYHARTKMSREDMKVLHMALRGKDSALSNVLVLSYALKIQREDIYDSIPETKALKTLFNTMDDLEISG